MRGRSGACVIGHILSGIALLSMGSLLFAIATVLTSWATTYLYLIGPSALTSGDRGRDPQRGA
jgi:hypothetical protein